MEGFRELIEIAAKQKRLLQVGYMWRYNPGINASLEAARSELQAREQTLETLAEQVAKADRTRIGLYATDEPISGTGITTLRVTETITLTAPVRILAIRPLLNQPLDAISVEATLPSGRKVSLLNLRAARPGWARRYWLGEPVELPAGTSVTVHVSGDNPAVDLLTVGP